MTTQVAFATDPALKTAVSQKLKANGMTLKGFLNLCMREYLTGNIHITVTMNTKPNPKEHTHD